MRIWPLIPLLFISSLAHASDYVPLFNGRDFTGWTFFLEEKGYNAAGRGKIADFATVKPGGVIELNPEFHGALMTERDYLNYDLHILRQTNRLAGEVCSVAPASYRNGPTRALS